MATSSFSKGCFLFQGSQASRKRKVSGTKSTDVLKSLVSATFEGPENHASLRYEAYKSIWEDIEGEIKNLQEQSHADLLGQVVQYVQASRRDEESIPTAYLTMGVNVSDHQALLALLESKIKSNCTPHVACLRAKDCPTIKQLISQTVVQIVKDNSGDWEDEEDGEAREDLNSGSKLKRRRQVLPSLVTWYEELEDKKPVVIILQDFEVLNPKSLQDFILILKSYRLKVPWVLIFGIATSPSLIQRSLHCSVSSSLSCQAFTAKPSVHLLNRILENVLIEPDSKVKLGPKVLRLLLDVFLYHDLSVDTFTRNLKVCVFEHFCSAPHSILCCSEAEAPIRINLLTKEHLELFRKLNSFRRYIEVHTNESALLSDDKKFKDFLTERIGNFYQYFKQMKSLALVVHKLCAGLPGAPFGKQFREVYCAILSEPLYGSEDCNSLLQMLKMCSRSEIEDRMRSLFQEFEDVQTDPGTQKMLSRLSDAIGKFDAVISQPTASPIIFNKKEKVDRFQLREQLLLAAKSKKPTSAFEIGQKEILDTLKEYFQSFSHVSSLPFYEVFFMDNIAAVKNYITPAPRAALQKALVDPHSYLQCSCCKVQDRTSVLATMPDLSIAYKLHLECGKLVNLYDWLQAFSAVLQPDRTEDARHVDPVLQARFMRCVSTLQLLGFIKPSKRKTDHVERLTWGSGS